MAKHIWSIACQVILTDQFSNSASYIQAVESISVPQLPIGAPTFMIGTLWAQEGGDTTVKARIRIVGPDGAVVAEVPLETGSFKKSSRLRQNSFIGGFQLSSPGRYNILVEQRKGSDWQADAEIPLDVELLTSEELAARIEARVAATSAT